MVFSENAGSPCPNFMRTHVIISDHVMCVYIYNKLHIYICAVRFFMGLFYEMLYNDFRRFLLTTRL